MQIEQLASMKPLARKDAINALQASMTEGSVHDVLPIESFFADGIYARQMMMPEGMVVVGKAKKREYMTVLSAGAVYEASEEGVKLHVAPATFVSPPFCKRVLWAQRDTVLTTYHATEATTVEEAEADIVATEY